MADINKLMITEITAILLVRYSIEYPQGGSREPKKAEYVAKLQGVIQEQGSPYDGNLVTQGL